MAGIQEGYVIGSLHRPVDSITLTAPALMPIYRALWEMPHGPEEPWPGVSVGTNQRFLRSCRLGWHDTSRPTAQVGIAEAFTQQTMELIRRGTSWRYPEHRSDVLDSERQWVLFMGTSWMRERTDMDRW
jgi:hypothetical protein